MVTILSFIVRNIMERGVDLKKKKRGRRGKSKAENIGLLPKTA